MEDGAEGLSDEGSPFAFQVPWLPRLPPPSPPVVPPPPTPVPPEVEDADDPATTSAMLHHKGNVLTHILYQSLGGSKAISYAQHQNITKQTLIYIKSSDNTQSNNDDIYGFSMAA